MFTIIGSLIGFLTSFLPKLLDVIQKRQDNKHELEIRRLDNEMKLKYQSDQFEYYENNSQFIEQQQLLKHDIQISKEDGLIGGLRKMVRPLITYCFFGFFMFFKTILVMEALRHGIDIVGIADIIWDEQSQAIFAAIVSFWFGSRAIEKLDK